MNKKTISILGIEIIILLALYGFMYSKYIEMLPVCWVYESTGFFCPACGITRCVSSLLQGNWIQAFFYHMVFFVGILYLLVINIVYIVNLNKKEKIGTWVYPKYWYVFIFVILLFFYTIIRNML